MPNENVFISKVSLPLPTVTPGRGGNQTKYPFASLPIGASIVVKDKNKKQLTTTVSTNNRDEWPVVGTDGKPVMEPVKDATGKVTGTKAKTEKRYFFVTDCDPATDPEGAMARIWRGANPEPAATTPVAPAAPAKAK